MDDSIRDFLIYDYGEAKDLAKSFLTLVSAVLVGTITFSEKFVNFQTAPIIQRLLVISSWVLFVFSIILSGISIVFYYNSVGAATSCGNKVCAFVLPFEIIINTDHVPHVLLVWGNQCMILAGGFFVLGLLALVISAVVAALPTNKSPLDIE